MAVLLSMALLDYLPERTYLVVIYIVGPFAVSMIIICLNASPVFFLLLFLLEQTLCWSVVIVTYFYLGPAARSHAYGIYYSKLSFGVNGAESKGSKCFEFHRYFPLVNVFVRVSSFHHYQTGRNQKKNTNTGNPEFYWDSLYRRPSSLAS